MTSADQLHQQYEVERDLAARLRTATRRERLRLYREVYDERIARVPTHPLVARASDPDAQATETARQLRLVRPFVNDRTRFLEIGPGDGSLVRAVASHVHKVYAIDVSLALARETVWPPNAEVLLTDGVSVPLAPESVDFAYSDQVLEHLHPDDAEEQTRNVWNALSPGSAYLCITPHRFSGPWDVSRFFDDEATGLHLREYTLRELVLLFRAAGFESVDAFLSFHGWHLSPVASLRPFTVLESGVARMPPAARRKIALLFAAVKILARKDRSTAK